MAPSKYLLSLILFVALVSLNSCSEVPMDDLTVYTNASVWDGTDRALQENAAIVTRKGTVIQILGMNDPDFPEQAAIIDLNNRFVVPGLINAHGHVGVAVGLHSGPEAESTDNVISQLKLYARYGITTVVSLGDEPIHAFLVRDNVDPAEVKMTRIFLAGDVLNPESVDAVEHDLAKLMEYKPDWTKIRVDDGLGQREKMPEEIYSDITETSHQFNIPLAAHIVTLEDAKGILRNSGDLIAHSIRDEPVDDELIDLMLERDVCITPTLTRELSVFVYAERPDFFDDPFFLQEADSVDLARLQEPEVQERFTGRAADYYREALPLAKENMMELHNAGVRVAMGTDSGPPARFQGYFEHLEMEMMQNAGMSPSEILRSATRYAAECMNIGDKLGTLEEGKHADFLVLDKNPFEDIRNLRSIHAVYIGGNEVERK